MTKEEAINTWLPIIKMGVEKMPERKEALDIAIKALERESCEDAISRQAVHEAIVRWAGSMSVLIALPTRETIPLLDSIHKLPSVNPQPKTEWISVSERLPGDSGTYFVTVHDGRKKRTTFARYQKKLKNWIMTGARAYWRVKAWMPLPEPYKAESEDKDDRI